VLREVECAYVVCVDACVVAKTLGWKFSEKLGGEPDFWNPRFAPFLHNLKTKQNLRLGSKAKL